MDWSLIIFIAVAIFFTYRGYQKGLIRSLSRLLSLLAGYIASILFIGPTSTIVASLFQLQGIVPFIIAALFLFIAGGVAVSFLFLLLGKMIPDQESTSTASSIGGAALGLGVGVAIAFVIVWTFAFVRDVRPTQQADAITDRQKSSIENLTNRVVSKAVNTAMSMASAEPEVTRLSTALVEAPAEIALQAQRLAKSNDLSALLGDSLNQSVLNSGDIAAVKKLPAFQKLVNNPDMQALAKSAGMTSESTDHAALETALAVQLVDITARVQRVQNNQRVQEILSDPEFQQKIQSNNPLELLTNVRLLELADIIFSDTAADAETNSTQPGAQTKSPLPTTPKKQTKIYSWTDENDTIHYTDVDPEQ